jgi:hypothetical protein
MNKPTTFAFCLGLLLIPVSGPAQNATNAAAAQPNLAKVREDARKFSELRLEASKLPPEERAKKASELNQKQVEAMKKYSPEERRVWMEEMRNRTYRSSAVNSEERQAQFTKKLEDLRAKKAEGKISEREEQLIPRLERALEEMRQRQATNPPAAPPTGKSPERVEPARN